MSVFAVPVAGYRLVPLRQVRCDDVAAFLPPGPGIFVCNCPEAAWYAHAGTSCTAGMAEARKRTMWTMLGPGARLWSMTRDQSGAAAARGLVGPEGIVHLGTFGLPGAFGRLAQAATLAARLWGARGSYRYVLVYNFDQPQFGAAWLATRLARRRLIVDHEDDHTLLPRARWKNWIERRARRGVDAAVVIHPALQAHYRGRPTCVASSFADLGYLAGGCPPLTDGMTLLYAGRLDAARGARLLPALVWALRRRLGRFTVAVAGDGPCRAWLTRLRLPELVLLGHLGGADVARRVAAADACLVLQPPDAPFSQGSFPSKIETYAAARRPIWWLTHGLDGNATAADDGAAAGDAAAGAAA